MFSSSSNQLNQQLFRSEIRASIAHCNALFRAGAITRIESERLKNGLWTVLKRAEFDRNFFDNADSVNVYAFIETRLFQLINEAANALKVGRSKPHRAAVALRLWLRDEIEIIIELIENLTDLLLAKPKCEIFAAFGECFKRDEMRFGETARRTNQMPFPIFEEANEVTSEIDFTLIAHELGFEKLLNNSVDSASDRDFCVEFAGATALTGLHLSNLATEVLKGFADLSAPELQTLSIVPGKTVKTFGHQTILLSLLKGLPIKPTINDLDETCEIVFEAAENLKFCLSAAIAAFKKLA